MLPTGGATQNQVARQFSQPVVGRGLIEVLLDKGPELLVFVLFLFIFDLIVHCFVLFPDLQSQELLFKELVAEREPWPLHFERGVPVDAEKPLVQFGLALK